MKRITKFKRSIRAISPVIATLLMIAIAVVASLVVYAWVTGYIGGTTTKASNSMLIQSTSFSTGNLVVYVQNVGQGTIQLRQGESVYVNSILKTITSSTPTITTGIVTFSPGTTASITTDYPFTTVNEKLKIKITATDGTFAEYTTTGSTSNTGTFPAWPTARFTMSSSNPNVGQSVTFTETSVRGDGTINQWSWNFGDGVTSSTQNPIHSYSATGAKTVTLTVTDTNSRTATVTHTVLVNDFASPVASFTFAPIAPAVSQSVAFSDTSVAGSGTINQWSWNFGDSATSSVQNPAHSYSSGGQKTVSLTVTNTNSKTSTTTRTVNVGVDAPTAEFTISSSNPSVGQTIIFADISVPGTTGTINQWSWNFGDSATSTTQNPTHSYSTPGTKTITLIVTDSNTKTSTVTHTITVNENVSPIAGFTFNPTVPAVSQTVVFSDTSIAGSGTINQWSWSFGTGASPASSNVQNPTASYSSEGQKTVSLSVTDSNGKTSTTTQTVQVNSATPTPTPTQVPGSTPTPTPSPTQNPTPTPTPTTSPTPHPTTTQITFAVSPAGSGTTTPSGTQAYNYGQTVNIQATAGTGYTFSSWTYNGIIEINNPTTSTTSATMLGDGTITANFISSSGNKLAFTAGTNQILARNVGSSLITVQRQTSSGSAITSGTTTINLATTSNGGAFYRDAACTQQITQSSPLIISSGSTANLYYKDSTTGTPTITASATSFASAQTTFNVNVLYSNFDGSNWLSGWTTGTQPPWYQSAVGEGVGGTQAAKSDSTNYLGGNDGPFTSDVSDTSSGNTMTVTFTYKVQNTDNANDLKILWSNAANPNLGQGSTDFHTIANIGLPGNSGWNSYTITFTRAANPTMFTTHFWFRFESSLTNHQGSGLVESVWVDNAMLSVT